MFSTDHENLYEIFERRGIVAIFLGKLFFKGKNDTISNLSNSFLENQISSKFGSTKLCYEIEFIA